MVLAERLASVALIGLSLAPLVIKVDPNLNVVATACLTVFIGCHRSVKPAPPSETMSKEHAMRFPFIGSAVLLSLFLLFKFLPKDLINTVLTLYFFVLGVLALSCVLLTFTTVMFRMSLQRSARWTSLMLVRAVLGTQYLGSHSRDDDVLGVLTTFKPIWSIFANFFENLEGDAISGVDRATILPTLERFLPVAWNESMVTWHLPYWKNVEIEFTKSQLIAGIPGTLFCIWYVLKKHWLANNTLGLAFSIQGIEMLSLGSFKIGAILLAGLFIYDIFWVFFTPVMVSVAKSFDAPIKLIFPTGDVARPFSMLGLGDIVIPGIFVALALRFDMSRGSKKAYFNSAFAGYTTGLLVTILVMNWFQAAQPALLYIVPCVIGFLAVHCGINGEIKQLLEFDESVDTAGDESADASSEIAEVELKSENKKSD